MASSGMVRRVALVRTADVSEELRRELNFTTTVERKEWRLLRWYAVWLL
jgi:hypothetical protein